MVRHSINKEEIGARIRDLRQKQGKTQSNYADTLHISSSYLALIELGKRLPTLEILAQIAYMNDVTVEYLLFGKDANLDTTLIAFHRLCDSYPAEKIQKALKLLEFYLKLDDMPVGQ